MKGKSFKRIFACVLALIMAFGTVDTVSAETIASQLTTSSSYTSGKLKIVMKAEPKDYKAEITSVNLKTGEASKRISRYCTVYFKYVANSWYQTTIKGIDSAGNYNGNEHTYYLAKSPYVSISVVSGQKMRLTWTNVTGTSYYKVYYKKGDKGSWKCIKNTTATSYKTGKLKKFTNYYFCVRAVKTVDGKDYLSGTPQYRPGKYIYK